MGYAETLTGARARKGEAQGVQSYQNLKGIFANPHISILYMNLFIYPVYTYIYNIYIYI